MEGKDREIPQLTTAGSLQSCHAQPHFFSEQALEKAINEERDLFVQLIMKTKQKLLQLSSRIRSVIEKMRVLQAVYLTQLLGKMSYQIQELITKLTNIMKQATQPERRKIKVSSKTHSSFNSTKQGLFDSEETEIQQVIRSNHPNVPIVTEVIRVLNRILKSLENNCLKINYYVCHRKFEDRIKSYSKRITVIASKLSSVSTILPLASNFPETDLFSLSRDHPRWTHLELHYVKRVSYGTREAVLSEFGTYIDYITYFMYFAFLMMKQSQQLNFVEKDQLFNENWSELLEIMLSQPTSLEEMKTIYSLPTDKFPKILWEITNLELFKAIVSPVLPSISFTQCLFIPKTQRVKLFNSIYRNLPFTYTKLVERPFKIEDYLSIKPYQSHVQIRVNSNCQFLDYQGCRKASQTILVHIHGGGFISMSSYVHQFYLRKWAKQLNVPIFSIEYGKAPEFPFPHALADCLEAYFWLLQNAKTLYNAKQVRIVLIGDSSGGNLVCSMVNFLINHCLPLPHGLIGVYPALRVDLFYTPSFLQGIDDMVLPHSILLKIKQAYVSTFKQEGSQYISPILASEGTLKQYPPCHLVTGSRDPLNDDCFRMVERINEVREGRAYLTVFEGFPHGFLHFDSDLMPNRFTRRALQKIQEIIGTMIES